MEASMPIRHKKKFGIYHWDTFDNTTFLVDEADTLAQARKKVEKQYGSRIRATGADQVDIVDKAGNIIHCFKVG